MLQPDQELAQFRIIRRLGAGGMGEVYLAEDSKLQRKVALKILLAEYFDHSERIARFQREARTAAGISHPNVMGIFDIGSAPDPSDGRELNFIVMEYIEGKPLNEYLNQIGNDLAGIVRLAEKISAGLAAAHKINVVHRDIKAGNIMIDGDDNPKILDFGLAKPTEPVQMEKDNDAGDTISRELTRAGKIIGTVSYMSPEQVRGEAVDMRSDIFSFGILLYKMVTGDLPFESTTQVSTLAKILESQPEPPRLKNDQVPAELERIIGKCLQKNANDRYQDTRDLLVDLRNLRRQIDSSVSGKTSGIFNQPPKTEKSYAIKFGWRQFSLIALVLIILGGLFWQILPDSGSSGGSVVRADENALAIFGFINKTGSDEYNWLQTGLPEILLTDLAESQALTIISRDRVIDCLDEEDISDDMTVSHEACLEAARGLGARHALSGAFYKMGENIRIDARLEEIATGKIVTTAKVVGGDPFAMVDSLTHKIAKSLNIDEKITADANVSKFTSSYPEAFKKYMEAMENFEKELHDEAIAGFKEAIDIDSTFALAYMRVGMSNVFEGRLQEGSDWFIRAKEYQDRLPKWESQLLDIYSDIWADQNFDDAFIKMEVLVKNYPEDKETRFIYGLMIHAFNRDTIGAFAQMDTALQLDPRFLFVLTNYAQMHREYGAYEKAIEYAQRAKEYHPDSPTPYLRLGDIYISQDKFDLAINEYEEMLSYFPGHQDALSYISRIYIHLRDFDKARQYVHEIKKNHADDPYIMAGYFNNLANLAGWEGKFKTNLNHRFSSLEQTLLTGDSGLITMQYMTISEYYRFYDMPDSAIFYAEKGFEYSDPLRSFDFYITIARLDPAGSDTIRPIFENALADFRTRLPEGFHPLADAIMDLFDGFASADTTLLIDAYSKLFELNPQDYSGSDRASGYFRVLLGQYEKGREILSKYIEGEKMTSLGFVHPRVHYHLGLAEEGLGNNAKAIEHFQEMLKFWGKPEIELDMIKDARTRLARLTS